MRGLAFIAALPGVLVAAGCDFEAEYNDVAYRCGADGQCPSGYSCVAGFSCELRQPCGTTSRIADEFGSADIDDDRWRRWSNEHLDIAQQGGQIQFDALSSFEEGRVYSGIGSRYRYRLKESSIETEIILDKPDSELTLYLQARVDSNFFWQMYYENGLLHLHQETNDIGNTLARLAYSPTDHRWWRLRESDGLVHFETSPNGQYWKTHGSATSAPYQNKLVEVKVEAAFNGGSQLPASATIEHVNRGNVVDVPWCPGADLRDDFAIDTSNAPGPEWIADRDGDCSLVQSDGQLAFDLPPGSYCEYRSSTFYDMTASATAVEVSAPGGTGRELTFSMITQSGDQARFALKNGMLSCTATVGGMFVPEAEVAFDPSLHKYWRVRGKGETIYWDVSADAVTWTELAAHTDTGLVLSEVYFLLAAEADTNLPEEVVESPAFGSVNITETSLPAAR